MVQTERMFQRKNVQDRERMESGQERRVDHLAFSLEELVLRTLYLWMSSILAVLHPSVMQEWKKDGATEIPRASLDIPVFCTSLAHAIVWKVPNSNTNNC